MKKVLIAIGIIIALFVIALAYYGAFTSVVVYEKKMGPFQLVYEKHVGNYKEVGEVIYKVYQSLKKDSIETTRGFGLYYDNPKQVENTKLRSVVGCILDDKSKAGVLKNYNIKEYPVSNCVVAEFPNKGTMSIIVGIFKAYPALGKYMNEKNYMGGPIMEIYDGVNKKIYYLCSVDLDMKVYDSFLDVK